MDDGGDQEADGEGAGHGAGEGGVQQWGVTEHGGLDDWPWQGQEPGDVSSVEDLSETRVGLLGVGLDVVVLGVDGDPAQVGGHSEVGDGHEQVWSDGGDVDESLVDWFPEHQEDEDDGEQREYTESGEQPIGATAGDVEVHTGRRVDPDGLVTASLKQFNRHILFYYLLLL